MFRFLFRPLNCWTKLILKWKKKCWSININCKQQNGVRNIIFLNESQANFNFNFLVFNWTDSNNCSQSIDSYQLFWIETFSQHLFNLKNSSWKIVSIWSSLQKSISIAAKVEHSLIFREKKSTHFSSIGIFSVVLQKIQSVFIQTYFTIGIWQFSVTLNSSTWFKLAPTSHHMVCVCEFFSRVPTDMTRVPIWRSIECSQSN